MAEASSGMRYLVCDAFHCAPPPGPLDAESTGSKLQREESYCGGLRRASSASRSEKAFSAERFTASFTFAFSSFALSI